MGYRGAPQARSAARNSTMALPCPLLPGTLKVSKLHSNLWWLMGPGNGEQGGSFPASGTLRSSCQLGLGANRDSCTERAQGVFWVVE